MNYTLQAIKAMLDSLPDAKAIIPGERLWVKVLEPGIVILNNNPLDDRYRWLDICKVEGNTVVSLIQRMYPIRLGFQWTSAATEQEDMELRKQLAASLEKLEWVDISFFYAGMGFILAAPPEELSLSEAFEQIRNRLSTVACFTELVYLTEQTE